MPPGRPDSPLRPGYYEIATHRSRRFADPPMDDFAARALAHRNRRLKVLGYRIEVTALEDGQFYWHVWLGAVKVNGGLCESQEDADEAAEEAAFRHSY